MSVRLRSWRCMPGSLAGLLIRTILPRLLRKQWESSTESLLGFDLLRGGYMSCKSDFCAWKMLILDMEFS